MPFLSIFSFISFSSYIYAAINWPAVVLEFFEGWPFQQKRYFEKHRGWVYPPIRWPQRIWGIFAFVGFAIIIFYVVHGMLDWIPGDVEASDDGDTSSSRPGAMGICLLFGIFGGWWVLIEFARMRLENKSFKFMAAKMKEAMEGGAWKRNSLIEEIKKDFSEKPSEFRYVFPVYDIYDAKEKVLNSIAELNKNIESISARNAEQKIEENCRKEKCSLFAKRVEKARLDKIERERDRDKDKLKVEGIYPEDSHEYLTEKWVKEIFFEKFGFKAKQIINRALLLEDLGLKGEKLGILIKELEDQFVLEIPSYEAARFKTVGEIVKYIQKNSSKIDLSDEASLKIADELVDLKRIVLLQHAIEEFCSFKLLPEEITKYKTVEELKTFIQNKKGLKELPKEIVYLIEEFIYSTQTYLEGTNSKYSDQDT